MKQLKINKLINFKYIQMKFSEHIGDLILFVSLMIDSAVLKRSYNILGFNYGLVAALYLLSLAFFYTFRRALIKKRSRIIFIVLLALIISGLAVFEFSKIRQWALNITQYYGQIYNAIIHSDYIYYYQFKPFLILLIPLFTILMLYTFSKKRVEFLFVFNILFAGYLWYQGFDNEIKHFLFLIAFINGVIFCLNIYNRNIRKFEKFNIKISVSKEKIIIYSLAASFVSAGFSFAIVDTIGSKSIPELTRDIRSKSKAYLEKSKKNRYDLSSSGYYENATRLGGPVYLNNELALKVKSDAAYYLRGNSKEIYDGHSWKKIDNPYTKKQIGEAANIKIYFLDHFNGNKNGNITLVNLDKKHLVVYPENITTSTLFAPNLTYDINSGNNYIGYDKSMSFIMLNKTIAANGYRVDFNSTNNPPETFEKLYSEGVNISYNTGKNISTADKDYYDKNIKDNFKDYLQLTNNLSQNIYALVNNIVKDCKNTSEKVIKIQNYLRDNYTYSLDVSEVPGNEEFLQYFLFKEKKGYCTYFATATTVFCRIAGIPSRYVEGFHMKDIMDKDGYYEVTNDMAHAWTEVLLDPEKNIWVTIDSVPAYDEELAKERNIFMSAGHGQYIKGRVSQANKQDEAINLDNKIQGKGVHKTISVSNIQHTIIYTAIIIICSILFYTTLRIYKFMRNKKAILASKSIIPLYCYFKGRIGSIGYEQDVDLGDMEWIDNIQDYELREFLRFITKIAYQEFYGKKEPQRIDRLSIYNFVEIYIREKQNLIKYIFLKVFRNYN